MIRPLTAWALLEAMADAADRGERHHMMDGYLQDVRTMARRQQGYLLGWQVRVAVAFLLAASEYPPDATDGDLRRGGSNQRTPSASARRRIVTQANDTGPCASILPLFAGPAFACPSPKQAFLAFPAIAAVLAQSAALLFHQAAPLAAGPACARQSARKRLTPPRACSEGRRGLVARPCNRFSSARSLGEESGNG